MAKRILYLEDLYDFYSSYKKSSHYAIDEKHSPIVVQTKGTIKFDNSDGSKDGLTPVKLQACHTNLNVNQSNINEDVMTAALPSFCNRPILGFIHFVNSEPYFYGHNMHEEDGEIIYDEIPIGIIPESCGAQLVYDEEKGKTYVEVNGYIFDEYTKAKEILEREQELSVSVELSIRSLSYNAKEKYLDIEDFYFSGVTILGCDEDGNEIKPGMQGSNIKLADFSAENNSLFAQKLDSMQEKLDTLLSRFDIDNSKEGGKIEVETEKNFDEVTETEQVTEAEETTEEEVAVTENESEETVEETSEVEETVEETETEEAVEEVKETVSEEVQSEQFEKMVRTFEISHDDIRYALYSLLSSYEDADNEWYWITAVYDSRFVYENWDGSRCFGQNYTRDNDNVAFDGERYELFKELLTASEKAELESMRANYSSIQEKLNAYEYTEQFEDKMSVFADDAYGEYLETEEFKSLMSKDSVDKFSKEELQEKADAVLGRLVKTNKTFSYVEKKENDTNKVSVSLSFEEEQNKPYGNLFD